MVINVKKLIIIKYAELTTKKDNINLFLKMLAKNLLDVLKNERVSISYDRGRMYIHLEQDNFDVVKEKLKKVFGIHEFNIAYELETIDLEKIEKALQEVIQNREFKTFKVETKRSNKAIPFTSVEISKRMGGVVLSTLTDVTVDVHNPDILITLELRKEKSYLYFEKERGLGGYPVGTLGKGLLMLSGGIDSPVAGYLGMKRGVKLEAIYFESPPHTSVEAKNKVIELARILATYGGNIKLHVINLTEIQEAIYKDMPHEYLITILRRMMYRMASLVAHQRNCKILLNGEAIGQVASQTLTSMSVINEVVKIPVIRPLACFDKLEIIDIAKKINTYETSILPFEDCCTIFVPKHPVINPELSKCYEYETLIDYKQMIYKAVKNRETITISTEKNNEFDDIL